uniref:Uncharacterized protein n=1 Tax=Anopheles arabiensis TaxID=7173 RepID=A0A182I656_ANOAR
MEATTRANQPQKHRTVRNCANDHHHRSPGETTYGARTCTQLLQHTSSSSSSFVGVVTVCAHRRDDLPAQSSL